jgi:hypothetical protein
MLQHVTLYFTLYYSPIGLTLSVCHCKCCNTWCSQGGADATANAQAAQLYDDNILLAETER